MSRARQRGQRARATAPPIVGTPDGRTTDDQARRIRDELEVIAGNADLLGLTAKATWQWAQAHPNSELHRHFTWDVAAAAEKRWADEARKVIASVRYQVYSQDGSDQPMTVRSVVSLKITDQRDQVAPYNGYIDRRAMLRQTQTRERFVGRAISELRQWLMRYCDVEELSDIRTVISTELVGR